MADVQLSTLGSVIKTAYEGQANTNAYTDAEKTKLAGVETSATADQTGAEIKAAYEAEPNTNAFTDALLGKLNGIAAGAAADHGALTGLADDDHSQYHTNARGDARYYTQGQVDSALSGKSDTGHSHAITDVTGLQSALDGKSGTGHTHTESEITDLGTYVASGDMVSGDANNTVTVDPKFWSGSQANYDAIGTKDSNTFYFIQA